MAECPEDLNLPISAVYKIIKDALPPSVNISKEARLAIGKAASVFVLYATSCANSIASSKKKKTISGEEVIQAISDMEFESFVPDLREYLEEFRKGQKKKKESLAKKRSSLLENDDDTNFSKQEQSTEIVIPEDES